MKTYVFKHNVAIIPKKRFGNGINPTSDEVKQMVSKINNPSSSIGGLGSGSPILAKSEFKPSSTTITYGGGSMISQLRQINFNDKKKQPNVKLTIKK